MKTKDKFILVDTTTIKGLKRAKYYHTRGYKMVSHNPITNIIKFEKPC